MCFLTLSLPWSHSFVSHEDQTREDQRIRGIIADNFCIWPLCLFCWSVTSFFQRTLELEFPYLQEWRPFHDLIGPSIPEYPQWGNCGTYLQVNLSHWRLPLLRMDVGFPYLLNRCPFSPWSTIYSIIGCSSYLRIPKFWKANIASGSNWELSRFLILRCLCFISL